MNPLTALIVDDESLARKGLALRLKNMAGVQLVGQCCNGEEALAAIAEYNPDLVFLDIQMPGMDGFEVVRRMQADNAPMVVFVTAYDEYAIDAFEVHAVDYVLKPIEEERLTQAVERALSLQNQRESVHSKQKLVAMMADMTGNSAQAIEHMAAESAGESSFADKLTIKDGANITVVDVADIQWVDAAGDYMCIHAHGDTHIMRITMKQLTAMLNPAVFLRIHRSTLVNAKYITGAQTLVNGEYLLNLKEGARLKVSRGHKDTVKRYLGGV